MTQDYEKLGVFYLGKGYDVAAGTVTDAPLLYDSRDLTTHAMCVGMTGSGKTGLCAALLEEAAIDGIPAIVIDPKGDLGNLMLAFPELRPDDFRPWLEEREALRKGLSLDAYAGQVAETWRKGLAEWGQTPERIARFKAAVEVAIYTPASESGRPLNVLRSFAAPSAEVLADSAALRERILTAVSGLLTLLGIQADPIRSREHILLSTLVDAAWRKGESPDLASLIGSIQKPPFDRVGVFDLETFFPAKDRLELAMALNNLIAAPGFSAWMQGEPLDVQRLLYTVEGTPRIAILSIAHLPDAERMFFVTILLNEVLAWMRSQPGTGSLRALLYMDEIAGYFPPTAMPPSKPPMLTLLKQARAFGLGVVLSTQNPVDLDYKGLANIGTWFIGRLQTERDKARLLDGLEGAIATSGGAMDRGRLEQMLASLGNRVFLMHNVHDDQPSLFQSRWALTYLRGPMTLPQIRRVMGAPAPSPSSAPSPAASAVPVIPASVPAPMPAASAPGARPPVPAGVNEYFLNPAGALAGVSGVQYEPRVLSVSKLHFVDAKSATDVWVSYVHVAPLSPDGMDVSWESAVRLDPARQPVSKSALPAVAFAPAPGVVSRAERYRDWRKTLETFLYQVPTLELCACPALNAASRPGESEGDFRSRLDLSLRERRDEAVEKLRRTYAPRLTTIQEQLRRAQQRVATEKSQVTQQTLQTAISVGATIFGALMGRKAMSVGTMGRAATAMRGAGRTMHERQDVGRAEETVEAVQQRMAALQEEFDREAERVQREFDGSAVEIQKVPLHPRKSDIIVSDVGLLWVLASR